jgi:hypothetical protein
MYNMRLVLLLLAIYGLVLCTCDVAIGGIGGNKPQLMHHPEAQYPLWVSAEIASKDNSLNSEVLSPDSIRQIEDILKQTPVNGCHEAGAAILDRFDSPPDPTTLAGKAKQHPIVAYGKVTDVQPGFWVGEAGSLVRVQPLSRARNVEKGKEFYIFIPVAEFDFLRKRICKTDYRYAGLPKIGDEVLAFSNVRLKGNYQYFSIQIPEDFILISGESVLYSPDFKRVTTQNLPEERSLLIQFLNQLLPY